MFGQKLPCLNYWHEGQNAAVVVFIPLGPAFDIFGWIAKLKLCFHNSFSPLGDGDDLCCWSTEDIEAGAFKESGTSIRTSLLLLEKKRAGSADGEWLSSVGWVQRGR